MSGIKCEICEKRPASRYPDQRNKPQICDECAEWQDALNELACAMDRARDNGLHDTDIIALAKGELLGVPE